MEILNNNQISKNSLKAMDALHAAKVITELNDKNFEIKDGVLIKCHSEEKVIIVPDGVERISLYAFAGMELEEVVLPSSLKNIDKNAFWECKVRKMIIPDNVIYVGENLRITYLSFNVKTTVHSASGISRSVRCKNLEEFIQSRYNGRVDIIEVQEEPTEEEIEKINHNISDLTITVVGTSEKSRYNFYHNLKPKLLVLGDDLRNVDFACVLLFEKIIIDNRSGNALKNFIDTFKKSDAYLKSNIFLCDIKTFGIIGKPFTFLEKRILKKLFESAAGNKLKFEKSMDVYQLKQKVNTDLYQEKISDKDIEEAINKVKKAIEDLTEDDRNIVLNQVNGLIAKYKDNLTKVKPSLDFNEDIPFGEVEETADSLREKLLRDLKTIENKFLMGNHYHELQDKIEDYEALINEQFIIEPTEIISVEDKIKYIIFFAKRYNQNNYINKLKDIFTKFKSDISEYCLRRVNSDILENTEDLNLAFNLRIDELYGEIQRFVLIYDCFYTPEKSTLAEDIVNIREIISLFDIENKEKYSTMLEELINRYYYDILTNKKDLKEGILELRRELMSFLEDLNKNAATFINYGNILNSLNHEKQNRALSIKTLYEELMAYIEESNLDQMNKDLAITELNKVVEKWKDKIKRKDLSTKEVDDPFKLEKMPISDDNIMLQIKILKDFYKVKATVDAYLLKKKAYDKVANKSIDTIEDTKPR